MSHENCGLITFSARKVTFLKVHTGKISAEGSKLFATQDMQNIITFNFPSDSESLTSGSSNACLDSDTLIILSTVFCRIDWFRLLLLYSLPQSLLASAAIPWTCRGRHQWYQDQVAILQVFADVLKLLQPT